VGAGDGWYLIRIAKYSPGARRATQRSAGTIIRDELQCLRRIVRGRTWLSHERLQSLNRSPQQRETIEYPFPYAREGPQGKTTLQKHRSLEFATFLTISLSVLLMSCGPRTHFPPLPPVLPDAVGPEDSAALLARDLAPVLYLQRDESFPLERTVAVLHPTRRVIAYYLTYEHDIAARWSPFAQGPDEEEFWVGYDATLAPTDLWTYWHGDILHANWRGRGELGVDVQWGKHGSIPHGTPPADLPREKSLEIFYAMTYVLPDLWFGRFSSRGPLCFCRSFSRYLEFTRPILLGTRLTAIGRTADPDSLLTAVFGPQYAHKTFWPWEGRRYRNLWRSVSGGRALLGHE
jgi:hypothetical protein